MKVRRNSVQCCAMLGFICTVASSKESYAHLHGKRRQYNEDGSDYSKGRGSGESTDEESTAVEGSMEVGTKCGSASRTAPGPTPKRKGRQLLPTELSEDLGWTGYMLWSTAVLLSGTKMQHE